MMPQQVMHDLLNLTMSLQQKLQFCLHSRFPASEAVLTIIWEEAHDVDIVFVSVMIVMSSMLGLLSLLRWYAWAWVQPTKEEQEGGQSPWDARIAVVRYTPLGEQAQVRYVPPSNTMSCMGTAYACTLIFVTAALASVGASFVAIAALICLHYGNSDDGQAHHVAAVAFLACVVFAVVAGALLWAVKGVLQGLLARRELGPHCFLASLPESYRLRATKIHHRDLLARGAAAVKQLQAKLTRFQATVVSQPCWIRTLLAKARIMFWVDLLLDVNTAWQLREKYPICSILVLCIVFCPYVALSVGLGPSHVKTIMAELHPQWFVDPSRRTSNPLWCLTLPYIDLVYTWRFLLEQPKSNTLMHYFTARTVVAEVFFEANLQVLVQAGIMVWQANPFGLLPDTVNGVSAPSVMVSILSSALTSYSGVAKLRRFGAWQCRGSTKAFCQRMLELGRGLASSSLLESLNERAQVEIGDQDLESLDLDGFMSIVLAIRDSSTLRSLTLPGAPLSDLHAKDTDPTNFEHRNMLLDLLAAVASLEEVRVVGEMSDASRSFLQAKFADCVPAHSGVSVSFLRAEGAEPLCLRHDARSVDGDKQLEQWRAELLAADAESRLQQFTNRVADTRQSAAPVELYLLRFSGAADFHESAGRLLTYFSTVGAEAPLSAVLASEATAPTSVDKASGTFPLLLAAQTGHVECVRLLLSAPGVQVRQTNEGNGTFPLLQAAQNGHAECVSLLLSAPGVEVAQRNEKSGQFPLLMAAFKGHTECVRLLLSAPGVEVTQTSEKSGNFPLLMAAQNGHVECVGLLLAGRADLEQVHQRANVTALDLARSEGQSACVEILEAASSAV